MSDRCDLTITDEAAMKQLGVKIGSLLAGGEVLELVGDVGAGKTTFTKGLALGMGITEPVQSPTFTISRLYDTPHGLQLAHYDFYRLHEAGVMADELMEVLSQPTTVTVVEWAGVVDGVLPDDRLRMEISSTSETERRLCVRAGGSRSEAVLAEIER